MNAPDPASDAQAAAAAIAAATGLDRHDVAVVLGSGWRPAADVIGTAEHELAMADLPGFLPPVVAGHGGTIRSVRVGDRPVLVLLGRTHLYEGRGLDGGGARRADGGRGGLRHGRADQRRRRAPRRHGRRRPGADLRPPQPDGELAAGRRPVHRPHRPLLPRAARLAREIDPSLAEGVYAGLPGPHFETPAEIRMLRGLGADLVGMSTVLEAIAARAEGVEVLGLSLVTNLAAGHDRGAAGPPGGARGRAAAAGRMGGLLRELVARS